MRPVVCDLNHFYSHVRYLVGATPLPNRGSCGSALSPPQIAHRDTVMAEKLQAIEALGAANSGMKDFYDLDRKSTRLTPVTNAQLVCRLLLEKKNRNFKRNSINHYDCSCQTSKSKHTQVKSHSNSEYAQTYIITLTI